MPCSSSSSKYGEYILISNLLPFELVYSANLCVVGRNVYFIFLAFSRVTTTTTTVTAKHMENSRISPSVTSMAQTNLVCVWWCRCAHRVCVCTSKNPNKYVHIACFSHVPMYLSIPSSGNNSSRWHVPLSRIMLFMQN